MNLRLDSNSIRIRVDQNEALLLSDGRILRETLPLGIKDFEVSIESSNKQDLGLYGVFAENSLKLVIAENELKKLLLNKEKGASKNTLELREIMTLGVRDIELRFEIDKFNYK